MKTVSRNEQIRSMIFAAILIALILIMTFIPQLGYITINAIPITIIHIPVIIGAILLGRKYGLLLGLVFGIGSMIRSFMEYSLYAPFTNPLLSVLPRAFIGLIAYDIQKLLSRVFKNEKLAVPFSLGLITLIHSIIVLFLLYLIGTRGFYFFRNDYIFSAETGLFGFIWGVLVSNSVFEIILAIMIGSPIIYVLNRVKENQK